MRQENITFKTGGEMKKNNRDCKYIKFYINDVEQKPRRNKKTGHIWRKLLIIYNIRIRVKKHPKTITN